MARIHNSFTIDVPPERAQEMFVRDIVPDLHRDGRFTLYREGPGEVRLSDANPDREPALGRGAAGGALLDLDDIADPDEFEAHEEEAGEPALADALRRGTDAEGRTAEGGREPPSLELLASHRIKVTFVPEGEGTRVTIRGSARHDVGAGLERLGRPDHWPAIAGEPHD